MTDNGQPGFPDDMGMNPTGNDPDATRRQASPYPDAGAPRAPRPPRQPGVRRGTTPRQQPAQPRSRSQAAAAMQGGGGRGRPPGGGYYDEYDDGYGQAGGDWIRMLVGGDDGSPDTAAVAPTTAPIPEIDVFGCAGEENPVGQQPIPSAASIVGRDAGSRWLAFANPQRPPAQLWVRASDVPDFEPTSVGTVPCTDNPEELPTPVGLATPTPFGEVADGSADGGETDGETEDGETADGETGENTGPTPVPLPTSTPLPQPTVDPNATPVPTAEPTAEPTAVPTEEPTAVPTEEPTAVPTAEPTTAPPLEPPNPRGEGGDGSGDGGEGDGGGL
ncbi:hypothetical protein GQR58_029974 [Nymphon striatum]|nr:hypothetical protein GQR58_029974 [Nymphon striatum]